MIVRESISINEEYIMTFEVPWTKERIEVYKNPKSLRRFEPFVRAVSDSTGNFWVADKSDAIHVEMIKALHKRGEIKHDWFSSEWDDNDIFLVGWQRYNNTNDFYLGESYYSNEIENNKEIKNQLEYFEKKALWKNPQYNFFINKTIDELMGYY